MGDRPTAEARERRLRAWTLKKQGATMETIAETLDISVRQTYNYLKHPEIRALAAEYEAGITSYELPDSAMVIHRQAAERLNRAGERAVKTLLELLDSRTETVRLRAAVEVMDRIGIVAQPTEQERRFAELTAEQIKQKLVEALGSVRALESEARDVIDVTED